MFSSRTNWHHEPNNLTRKLQQLRASGRTIIDLTLSNPTEAGFEYPGTEILDSLSNRFALQYRPEPFGLLTAREAVADYYSEKNITVSPNDILLTASSSEAYAFLFTLLCEAGDNVLVPNPTYPLFEFLTQLQNVDARPYQLRYDGEWHIDIGSVRRAVTPSTKAIVIVNPHNPTGVFLKRSELEAMNDIANQHSLALIVDEVFLDYGRGEGNASISLSGARVGSTASHEETLTFTLNGISKSCGLPQMKLGWMVVSGKDELKQEVLKRLEIIADTFLSVNTPVQHALPQLLKSGRMIRRQISERVQENLSILKNALHKNSSLSLLTTEGGWYAILKIPGTRTEEEWAIQLLDGAGVYVFPGYFFEFQEGDFLVVSLLPSADNFRKGIEEIVRIIK